MATKILLIRIADPHKLNQFINVLSTVASLCENSYCYLLVSRAQLKLKIHKNESNLCEVVAQFKSIFFDDYKYIQKDYMGHGFLINGVEELSSTLETFRKSVSLEELPFIYQNIRD